MRQDLEPIPVAQATRLIPGACPHDCPDTCALQTTVVDGRAVKVQGSPDHPTTHGALCAKVGRYPERIYHPERLLHPMKRVGPKGSGQFQRVGWDEALADIAARLKALAEEDPEQIVPYSYAGTMGMVQGEGMAGRFFHRLGASLLDRTICASAGGEGLALTYGAKVGMRVEAFEQARLILIWGSNSIASNLHFWTYAQRARKQGARLVCIDPRRTETAERCDLHLAIRPGSDGALALALMHELVVHDFLDHDYIARHTEGWEPLREEALRWPPERAAEACGIPAQAIRDLARDYAATRPAAIRLNYGMQRVRGGGNAARLVAILPTLVGAWKEAGGGLLLSSSGWTPRNPALTRPDLLGDRRPRHINMSAIGDALMDPEGPPIRALVVYNSNPVAVAPQSRRVVEGFRREDLFTVVLEHFMTDTADLADYVLPATMQLEHWDVVASYGHTSVVLNRPAIEPQGEARPNSAIFRELARRMGFEDPCFQDTDEDLINQAFRPGTVDLDLLRAQGWVQLPVPEAPFAEGGFPTPTGRCRISGPDLPPPAFLPPYESRESDQAMAVRYPLAMISPPARNFLNSTFVNVRSLRDIEGEPILEIHPSDAEPRGIHDGMIVRAFNDRGESRFRAVVGDRARPGVVNGLGVWWRKYGLDGTNVNELTHQRLTDLGGGAGFYDCLVEVAAVEVRP